MKTLVTGATGFIGKHLVKALIKEGREVRCLVRKTSSTNKLKDNDVEFIVGDLHNKQSLENATRGIDIVHHLAGEVYTNRVEDFYKTNVSGTKNLLECCCKENIKQFIHLSTISVTGPNPAQYQLLTEESPCHPVTPYGKSKLEGEQLVLKFHRDYGLPVTIIRPPTIYGPGGQPEMVTKIIKMISNRFFFVIGSGDNLRSLCYIDNLIQGIFLAEKCRISHGEIFFIADDKAYTFNQILSQVAKEEGVELSPIHLPKFVGLAGGLFYKTLYRFAGISSMPLYTVWTMVLDLACDISKAKNKLGFSPQIDIEEGIKRTIPYYIH